MQSLATAEEAPQAITAVPDVAPIPVSVAAADAAIPPAPAAFGGAAPRRIEPPRALAAPVASTLSSGTWAVVMGVNDYPGTDDDLHYAVNDATEMVKALNVEGVDSQHILFLHDGQVTPNVVHSAVDWLNSHAGPDAVGVFFYAGHVLKRSGTNSEALVTSDGGRVWDVDLARWLKPLPARRAWIALATCYSGGFDEVLAPGRVLTAAAGPDDVAYESSRFQRSYLGEYLLHRAIVGGAANASVQDAFEWAKAEIARDYPDRQPYELDAGNGPLILHPPGFSPQSAPAQSSPPQPSNNNGAAPPAAPPSADPAPPPSGDGGNGDGGGNAPAPRHCTGIVVICN